MEDEREIFLRNKKASYSTPEAVELKTFRSFFTWVCLDQSNLWRAGLTGSIFFVLAIGVPLISHFVFSCSSCDAKHRRPYDAIVQSSLSLVATLSFYSLSSFAHNYGLRRFLFLDKLGDSREKVRQGYTQQLRLCSITLVTGLFICLRSATKITHKAQAVTCHAAKWHICATINSFDDFDSETPRAQVSSPLTHPIINANSESDNEEGDGDDNLDNTKMVPIYAHTISYQKRQALVTYFENNRAGITVFGFLLDRTWLRTIFVIQLSLTLWLLNKTIGIS